MIREENEEDISDSSQELHVSSKKSQIKLSKNLAKNFMRT